MTQPPPQVKRGNFAIQTLTTESDGFHAFHASNFYLDINRMSDVVVKICVVEEDFFGEKMVHNVLYCFILNMR